MPESVKDLPKEELIALLEKAWQDIRRQRRWIEALSEQLYRVVRSSKEHQLSIQGAETTLETFSKRKEEVMTPTN